MSLGPLLRDAPGLPQHPGSAFALLHTESDIVAVVSLSGRVISASPTLARVLGVEVGDPAGRDLCSVVHASDRATLLALSTQIVRDGKLRSTVRIRGGDGEPVWLDVAARLIDEGRRLVYVSARDVTHDTLATAHLAASEQQWRLAFEHSPIGGALLDVDGSVLLANDAFATMLGHRPDVAARLTIDDFTPPDDRAAHQRLWEEVAHGRQASYSVDQRYLTADGRTLWGHVTAATVLGDDGSVRGVLVQLQDVTDQREAELQLANRALHDSLTGLPNRFLTRQWLSSALEEHQGQSVGVLYCDLDRFKVVNDSLGHGAGDEFLVEAAERLQTAVGEDGLVGRVGGDEFVIIFEGVKDEDELVARAAVACESLDEPIRIHGHLHTVTLSVGAALGADPDTADALLMRADLALLRAKRLGRARVELFDSAHDRIATRDDLELEDHLRASVQNDELRAFYQPVVTLVDRRVVGHEALLRWEHPQRGLLHPDRFLDLAETSGLIRPIGWWMLSQACGDTAGRRGTEDEAPDADLWVAVNASPSQLARPGVVEKVQSILAATGLRPGLLHLEVTETALIQASSALVAELQELSESGVRIVLDDFGTGFSSLSLLRDFPVDMVKIDRSFIAPLLTDRSALAIVKAVLGMCHDIGLPTVAEGVETEEQAALLTALGCSHAQGFLFGYPRRQRVTVPRV